MDLFELLFIALFILFPILEGVARQRKKRQGAPPETQGDSDPTAGGAERERGSGEPAAEMLPDDLWELMTGQRREREPEPADAPDSTPWSVDPEPSPTGETVRESEPWAVDDEATAPEPVSVEYTGPEAYSLETPAPEPLERTVPTAAARHRAFHELIDRPQRTRPRRVSPLMRSLRDPEGLRQAVLLKEILGPPKGLE